jgi:hypothetical protein
MTPPHPWDGGDDAELDALLGKDPELLQLSHRLRAARPDPVLAPHFKAYLRARLSDAAARELRPRRRFGLFVPRPAHFAWGGGALGAAMIAAVVVTLALDRGNNVVNRDSVTANAVIDGKGNVDPNDNIRISFSQAMDHSAVERGLRIQPATEVNRNWDGNTLVLAPVNKLSANTPYTVTITRDAARTVDGHVAPADIQITFGTHPTAVPTPAPTPEGPPALTLHPVGPVDPDSQLLLASDGSLLATSASAPASTPTPAPSTATPMATATPKQTPTPTPTTTPTPTATPDAQPGKALVRYGQDGTATRLGAAARVAALSAHARMLALLVPSADGKSASIVVTGADGSRPATLTSTADPGSPLAWGGDDLHPAVIFLGGDGRLRTVDLEGRVRTLPGDASAAPGALVVLAPDGHHAYITGSAPGSGKVVDLDSGASHPLATAGRDLAFSQDGSRVVWVDATAASPVFDSAPAGGGDPTTLALPGSAGGTVDGLALNGDGSRVAYLLHGGDGSATLGVIGFSGGVIAQTDGRSIAHPVLSSAGDVLAAVDTSAPGRAVITAVPGGGQAVQAGDIPAEASVFLGRLLDGQIAGNVATLKTLASPGVADSLISASSINLSRGYLIGAEAAADSPTAVNAHLRLIRDATKTSPVLVSEEDVTIDRAAPDKPYVVTAVKATPLAREPVGPQIVHVDSAADKAGTVLHVSFDSDLRPETVAGAISVLSAAGKPVDATVSYDPRFRVATVTVAAARPLTLLVGQSLLDVDGQPLASAYRATISG